MINKPKSKMSVLFLCTGNSCRSQMAEGLCRHYCGELLDTFSAGIETHGLNPNAVKVMQEIGIDISNHTSKTLEDIGSQKLDYVVTVCGHADETCPIFPGDTQVIHQGFDDPPKLALSLNEEDALDCYRRVRDEIKAFVKTLPDQLSKR